jgi:hypothetical protein
VAVAVEPLQDLHTPHRRRRLILVVGILLATMDLCCLPITYDHKTFPAAAWHLLTDLGGFADTSTPSNSELV